MPAAPTAAALNGSHDQLLNAYANLPVAFVENRGQIDERVRYYAQGPRYAFYLTRDELVLSFMNAEPAKSAVAISLQFLGGNPRAVLGDERAPGEVNYFRGNDPARWHRALPRYGQIVYRELWPGVDLSLREQGGTLKYRVPGAAWRADRGHRSGLPRVERPCAGRRGRAADRDGHGRAARLRAGGISDDRRRACAGREPLRAAGGEGPLRFRRRQLSGRPGARDRSGRSIRDLPGRGEPRTCHRHRGRCRRQRVCRGHDAVARIFRHGRARSGEQARRATSRTSSSRS